MQKFSFEDQEEVRFTVVQGSNAGGKVAFAPGIRSIRIGRAVENDIVLSDRGASRAHAKIDIREDGVFLSDLGSKTGVMKLGFPVGATPEPIESGDEFKIADTILRFEIVLKRGATKRAQADPEAAKKRAEAVEKTRGAVTGVLHQLGLRTPIAQGGALAAVAAAIAFLAWPKPPALPPQSMEPLPVNYEAVIGFAPGYDQTHADGAMFNLPTDSAGVGVYFTAFAPSGLEVSIGPAAVASLEASSEWRSFELLTIPRAVVRTGRPTLVLDNLGWAAGSSVRDPRQINQWAVAKMHAVRIPAGAALPARIADELRTMQSIAARLDEDASFLYQLIEGLRGLAISIMKLSGQSATLIHIPVAKKNDPIDQQIQAALDAIDTRRWNDALSSISEAIALKEGALNKEFQEKMNAVSLLKKKGADREIARLLAFAILEIPSPTDPRNREIQNEVSRLGPGGQKTFEREKAALTDF